MWKHPKQLNKIEDFSRPIIYWTWNGKCGVFKDNIVFYGGKPENKASLEGHIKSWEEKCDKYNIKWFQFQDDIAPKGSVVCTKETGWFPFNEENITKEVWDAIGLMIICKEYSTIDNLNNHTSNNVVEKIQLTSDKNTWNSCEKHLNNKELIETYIL